MKSTDTDILMPLKQATADDAAALNEGLMRLSDDMGDTHRATTETVAHALRTGIARAILAGEGETIGIAVYSPVLSTTQGAAGAYVSDLWIAPAMRGSGLGRRLLRSVANDAHVTWRASFLKLIVYDDNPDATAFYDRLGFKANPREISHHIVLEELL